MTNEEFEAVRFIYKVEFTGLYDGDSIDVYCKHGLGIYSLHNKNTGRMRLLHINAPELRGGTEETKALAIISRDKLAEKIVGKEGWIKTHLDNKGGFGRFLAEVWIDGECINTWMLDNGYAVPYIG